MFLIKLLFLDTPNFINLAYLLCKVKNTATIFHCLLLLFTFQQAGFTQKTNLSNTIPENALRDPRDGQIYKTITFNNDLGMDVKKPQIWLAENLRYKTKGSSWWYENNEKKNRKYGRLYTLEAAKNACPKGWRLPTDIDWQILMHQLIIGGLFLNKENIYNILIERRNSGFAALLGGGHNNDSEFYGLGKYGYYWSATELDSDNAWFFHFNNENRLVTRNYDIKLNALSCRCIKD